MAGFISERWPASNRNGGRNEIGIAGRALSIRQRVLSLVNQRLETSLSIGYFAYERQVVARALARVSASPELVEEFRRQTGPKVSVGVVSGVEADLDNLFDKTGLVGGRTSEPIVMTGLSRATLRVGTMLVREYARVLHRVTVVPEGFDWEGKAYASLSAVARAITGVRWNGHRFFALDRTAKKAGDPRPKKLPVGASTAPLEPSEALRFGNAT